MSDTLIPAADNLKLIKGIRVRNTSVKIYERNDGQFTILLNKYLWRFRVAQKHLVTKNYEEAEDYLLSARFAGKFNIPLN